MVNKILQLPPQITYNEWLRITKIILNDKENTYTFPDKKTVTIIPDPIVAEFI